MKHWLAVVVGTSACLLGLQSAHADSIVINGQRLDNVLITKTSAFYYVQLPKEGRTLNIPIDNVNAADVSINDDPFYRDDLKAKYAENKEKRDAAAAEDFEVDPAFRAGGDRLRSGTNAQIGTAAGGGGGGGGGMGGSRTQLEQMLANFGAQFEPGPGRNGFPSVVANLGGASLELIGTPDELMGMIVSATAPAPQIEMMIGQQRMMSAQQSPEGAKLFNELVEEAKQSGHAERTANGGKVEMTYKPSGNMVQFEFKALPAN